MSLYSEQGIAYLPGGRALVRNDRFILGADACCCSTRLATLILRENWRVDGYDCTFGTYMGFGTGNAVWIIINADAGALTFSVVNTDDCGVDLYGITATRDASVNLDMRQLNAGVWSLSHTVSIYRNAVLLDSVVFDWTSSFVTQFAERDLSLSTGDELKFWSEVVFGPWQLDRWHHDVLSGKNGTLLGMSRLLIPGSGEPT